MSSCNVVIDPFAREDSKLDISEKYLRLMQDSMHSDSLYTRAKDTMKVLFEDLQLTEKEKAGLAVDYVTKITVDLSKYAMSSALTWSKEERDGAYALAKLKADTEVSLAQAVKVEEEICLIQSQVKAQCASTMSTVSGSFRENGKPIGYEADGCTPTGLDETGVKWHQSRQAEADAYSRYADAYRQSGVVLIGNDMQDGVKKGLSGDADGQTYFKQKNTERLIVSYEDSKRNNAANSSATMIASMLSSEIAPNEDDVQRWRDAIDFLNESHVSV